MKKKDKGKVLMDQKANTVADMAAVLAIQARPPSLEVVERMKRRVRSDGRPIAKRGLGSQRTANVFEFQGKVEGVRVWWVNTLDAEYAETWPEEVKHGKLAVDRGTAIWPPPIELAHEERNVEVEEKIKEEKQIVESKKARAKRKALSEKEKKAIEAEKQREAAEKQKLQNEEAAEQAALRAKNFLQSRPESIKHFDEGSGISIKEKIRDAEMRARAYAEQQKEELRP